MPEWTWGDRVRKVRRMAKLGQVEFGKMVGASAATVAAWEVSANEPRNAVTVAKRIELALGWPAAWMLGLNMGHPSPPQAQGESDSAQLPGMSGDSGGSMTTHRYPHSNAA